MRPSLSLCLLNFRTVNVEITPTRVGYPGKCKVTCLIAVFVLFMLFLGWSAEMIRRGSLLTTP